MLRETKIPCSISILVILDCSQNHPCSHHHNVSIHDPRLSHNGLLPLQHNYLQADGLANTHIDLPLLQLSESNRLPLHCKLGLHQIPTSYLDRQPRAQDVRGQEHEFRSHNGKAILQQLRQSIVHSESGSSPDGRYGRCVFREYRRWRGNVGAGV